MLHIRVGPCVGMPHQLVWYRVRHGIYLVMVHYLALIARAGLAATGRADRHASLLQSR